MPYNSSQHITSTYLYLPFIRKARQGMFSFGLCLLAYWLVTMFACFLYLIAAIPMTEIDDLQKTEEKRAIARDRDWLDTINKLFL